MDLSTTYMGLQLKNPLVPAPSPLSQTLDGIRKMEDAGAAAVVMFSLFEEQVQQEMEVLEQRTTAGTEAFAESLTYFPNVGEYRTGTDQYLELISKASKAVDIPIIGSINGVSQSGWVEVARRIEEAGAKALELNVYYIPTEAGMTGALVERAYVDVLKAVKARVGIPVAVKLHPYFSSIANMAAKLTEAGADALVLFNRFYQPDINTERPEVVTTLALSTPQEMRLAVRWIAILHGRVKASLAATTGIHSVNEIVKYIMAGADVTMMASVLLTRGIGFLRKLREDLEHWMESRGYESIAQMRGSVSQQSVTDPTAFERANYIKILEKYKGEYSV